MTLAAPVATQMADCTGSSISLCLSSLSIGLSHRRLHGSLLLALAQLCACTAVASALVRTTEEPDGCWVDGDCHMLPWLVQMGDGIG